MSWTRSGTIIRRLPLSRNRRLQIHRGISTDARRRIQPGSDSDSQALSLSPSCSRHRLDRTSRRRLLSSSAFFSTAQSVDFSEDDNAAYELSTIDRIVSGGIGEYQSIDVDSVVTEDYLQRLVDDHISRSEIPPNPNMLLNMLEVLHNEEAHISSEIVEKIFREVVRSKRVKLLKRAEDVVVKNRYDPRLLRLLVTGYINANVPESACKLLMEWPNESMQHQPGIESYRRVLTALGPPSNFREKERKQRAGSQSKKQTPRSRHSRQRRIDLNKDQHVNLSCQDQGEHHTLQKNHRLAHRLLKHMCQTHLKFPELGLAPDRDCFQRALNTCSSIESLPTAKLILDEMAQRDISEMNISDSTYPNTSTMRFLTDVWTSDFQGDLEAVEMQKEAFEFLRRIEVEGLSSQKEKDSSSATPSSPLTIVGIDCYNVILNRLAELGQYELAETMFRRLLTDYLKGEISNVQPDEVTINTVLKSHVKAHTEAAALSAERFLDQLDNFYEQQEQIRKKNRNDIDNVPNGTPRIVYEIQPTARARGIISNLWVQLRQPHRAWTIIEKAESIYHEKQKLFHQQHAATTNNDSISTIKKFRPDHISYRQIIGALCKMEDPPTSDLASKAEEVGERLCKMGHRLNLLTCNTILNCWTKAGNPDRAEIFLEETMREQNTVPDIVSFNTIIHGHAQLGNLDRALELLTRLLEDSTTNIQAVGKTKQQKRVKQQKRAYPTPNVRTFTNIIFALSKKKTIEAVEDAEKLLLQMQELNEPPYNFDTRPNNVTYNAVMACWASLSLPPTRKERTEQSQKGNTNNDNDFKFEHHRYGRKAEFILHSMQGLGVNEKPNAISYNTVIRAYSNDMNKAEELVREMIANGLEPTHHTYKTLVHVLNRDHRIKNKERKIEEIRELYFSSSPFVFGNEQINSTSGTPTMNRKSHKRRTLAKH